VSGFEDEGGGTVVMKGENEICERMLVMLSWHLMEKTCTVAG